MAFDAPLSRLVEPPPATVHVIRAGGPADEPLELGVGDSIAYPGGAPHVSRALVPGTFAVLASEYRRGTGCAFA